MTDPNKLEHVAEVTAAESDLVQFVDEIVLTEDVVFDRHARSDAKGQMRLRNGEVIPLRQVIVDAHLNPTGVVTMDGRVGRVVESGPRGTQVVWAG